MPYTDFINNPFGLSPQAEEEERRKRLREALPPPIATLPSYSQQEMGRAYPDYLGEDTYGDEPIPQPAAQAPARPSAAEADYLRVLQERPQPQRPGLLRSLGAIALGAGQGWLNSSGRVRPVDTSRAQEALIQGPFRQKLAEWQAREAQAKAGLSLEQGRRREAREELDATSNREYKAALGTEATARAATLKDYSKSESERLKSETQQTTAQTRLDAALVREGVFRVPKGTPPAPGREVISYDDKSDLHVPAGWTPSREIADLLGIPTGQRLPPKLALRAGEVGATLLNKKNIESANRALKGKLSADTLASRERIAASRLNAPRKPTSEEQVERVTNQVLAGVHDAAGKQIDDPEAALRNLAAGYYKDNPEVAPIQHKVEMRIRDLIAKREKARRDAAAAEAGAWKPGAKWTQKTP